MRAVLAFYILALLANSVIAQENSPSGIWRDEFGTTIQFSLCGEGTQLCAVLLDAQGRSRTEDHMALLNRQSCELIRRRRMSGTARVTFDGSVADSTVTQVGPDTMEIQGCRAVVLCQTPSVGRMPDDAPAPQ